MPVQPYPLFFMHIGKTAGSYINQCLLQAFGPHYFLRCCERVIASDFETPYEALVRGKIAFSGHVYLEDWKAFCTAQKLTTMLTTVLRSPLHQIASTMRFLDSFNYPERYPDRDVMDPEMRTIVLRLRDVDLQDAGSIDAFLSTLPPFGVMLFDNHQSRCMLAKERGELGNHLPKTDPITLDARQKLIAAFDQFAVVGLTERLPETLRMLSALLGHPITAVEGRINESTSPRKIDLEDEWIRRALGKRILVDEWLYRHAVRAFEERLAATASGSTVPA